MSQKSNYFYLYSLIILLFESYNINIILSDKIFKQREFFESQKKNFFDLFIFFLILVIVIK